jgi:sterol O-acyltransferase
MVLPTFIYQINYPKTTHKKSMLFIFQKLILAALLIIKVYHITTENMLPVIYEYKNYRFMSFYLRMVIPISVTYLISIFIAFDLILNTVAEITGFADRQFYEVLFLNRITGTLLM